MEAKIFAALYRATLMAAFVIFGSAGALQSTKAQSPPPFPCLNPPKIVSTVPGDSPITDQDSLNCFAWQEFIALNWKAAGIDRPAGPHPKKNFGKPGDLTPTVWETFSDIHQVFLEGGKKPLPFGQRPSLPPACQGKEAEGLRTLARTSKFTVDFELPDDTAEAFPGDGAPNWLADKHGNQVFYEILMNRNEFDYIVANRFYNAATTYFSAQAGVHIDLPRGHLNGKIGSIELKAAWLSVPNPNDIKWRRYKLSEALLYDEMHKTCKKSVIALVGLHIIHKTKSQPQWVWATFEHVDNAPDQAAVDAGPVGDRFTFFDPKCKPQKIPPNCVGNKVGTQCSAKLKSDPPPTMTSCKPNESPGFCITADCRPLPVQVTRVHAIANGQDNLVVDTNQATQALIREKAGNDSVWANYMLIDVLWSDSSVDENTRNRNPPLAPLSISGMRPAPTGRPVSNTMLETYIQSTTCIQCHMSAEIAWPSNVAGLKPFASDYSFVFKSAKPATPGN